MALTENLAFLYGAQEAQRLAKTIDERLDSITMSADESDDRLTQAASRLSQRDAALICYGNSIVSSDGSASPLQSLRTLLEQSRIHGKFSIVHLLPFFPWDTDRGFSVIDYRRVDPQLGSWGDIEQLAGSARLMFDLVMNHASFRNSLVQGSLIARHLPEDDPRYRSYAGRRELVLAYDPNDAPSADDLRSVVRPRPDKLLTPYVVFERTDHTLSAILGEPHDADEDARVMGTGLVWTTFSRPLDAESCETTCQVDLDFRCPATFLEMFDICLFYAQHGCQFIRLDAVAYIWKKLGSSCIHEPEAHALLSALANALAMARPKLLTVGEINEPQDLAFSYLHDEAHLVYQFAHFPLAVYGVRTGDARPYANWLTSQKSARGRQFLTVLGSHDGMGLKPIRDRFLTDFQLDAFVADLEAHGGRSNYCVLPGGQRIVYEVCGTAWSLINAGFDGDPSVQIERFLAVVSLGMIPRALPAFYINSLLATDNYSPTEGLDENRTVNREILDVERVMTDLCKERSRMQRAVDGIARMLAVRAEQECFSPWGPEPEVVVLHNHVIGARLYAADASTDSVMVLVNLSDALQLVELEWGPEIHVGDLLTQQSFASDATGRLTFQLAGYETVWLK